jgi:hypothetical protein
MGNDLSKEESYSSSNIVHLFSCFPYPPQLITTIEAVEEDRRRYDRRGIEEATGYCRDVPENFARYF